MPAAPITFYELPAAVRTAIEAETGPIRRIENINTGLNSSLSARAHTTGRTVFLKGLRTGHRWVWTQQREADVNPYVTPLPRVFSFTSSSTAGTSSASRASWDVTPTTHLAPLT